LTQPLLTDSLQSVLAIKRMWLKWKNLIFYQSIGFCYFNTHEFKKRLQTLTLKWLDQRFPNFFEHDPNLRLANTPQTTTQASNNVRKNDCMSDFGHKLLSSFLMSAIYSFRKYLSYAQTRSGNVENTQPRLGSPRRDPFLDPSRPLFGFRSVPWEPLG